MKPSADAGTIVIGGGSGFLGQSLARHLLDRGYRAVVLSRGDAPPVGEHARWDARTAGDWKRHLDGALAVVNLAGRTVDCIKSPEHCDEILRSRVESVRAIGAALREVERPPETWVQMSTAHIYGDPPAVEIDESSAFGYGLAPTVGKAWEAELRAQALHGQRTVLLRTSFVLGRTGGALPMLMRLARFGLGGKMGHGRQGMSWLHVHDMNRIFERAITDPNMAGAYLATAPTPVSQRDFMAQLRRAVRMPIGLPTPAPLARLGARLVFRTDPDLALTGRFCVPRRLLDEGFEFDHPELGAALEDLARG